MEIIYKSQTISLQIVWWILNMYIYDIFKSHLQKQLIKEPKTWNNIQNTIACVLVD